MNKHDLYKAGAVLALAALLSACGGGGGGGDDAGAGNGDQMPASALTSIESLVAFAKERLASLSETSEPFSLGSATVPTSESADPL